MTEPHPYVKGIAETRQARLISGFGITVLLLGVALIVQSLATLNGGTFNPITLIAVSIILVFYILSRTQYYQFALHGMLITMVLGVLFGSLSAAGDFNSTRYLVLPVLVASVLLPMRIALLYAISAVVANHIVGVYLLDHGMIQPNALVTTGLFTAAVSALLFVLMQHLRGIEQERQRQILDALKRTEQANAELAKANALARETTRLKSEFMATMSHELRTPLNAINGFCGIMLQGMGGEIDSDAQHMVERINSNGERLLHLINEVLDLAKIEAGRLELMSEPMHLQELALSWKSQMSVLAQKKGLSFDVNIDPLLPTELYGDQERLTQVVVNLLSNAFKFTEKGGVRLDLRRSISEGGDSDQWQIDVIDSGIGIPPHAINYIFEEFRQVDGSTRRVYGGSGLGLAIARNLCRMMDGTIRVTSELGQGSHFTVSLPLRAVEENVPADAVAA